MAQRLNLIPAVAILLTLIAAAHYVVTSTTQSSPERIVNTSNWKTFRHDSYLYEISYPTTGKITSRAVPAVGHQIAPGSFVGQEIEITVPDQDNDVIQVHIRGDDDAVNIDHVSRDPKEAANQSREAVIEMREGAPLQYVTDVEDVDGMTWHGYQYTFRQDYPADIPSVTFLFIAHKDTLYRVAYDKTNTLQAAIVSTLRFLD